MKNLIRLTSFSAAILALAATGCSSSSGPNSSQAETKSIDRLPPLVIPSMLTSEEVKQAIVRSIPAAPESMKDGAKIADNALRVASLGIYKSADKRETMGVWYVEDIRASSVVVGHTRRDHYLQIEYIIKDKELIQHIAGSQNLDQDEDSIHKAVYEWMREMEARIRQSMGKSAADKIGTASK